MLVVIDYSLSHYVWMFAVTVVVLNLMSVITRSGSFLLLGQWKGQGLEELELVVMSHRRSMYVLCDLSFNTHQITKTSAG